MKKEGRMKVERRGKKGRMEEEKRKNEKGKKKEEIRMNEKGNDEVKKRKKGKKEECLVFEVMVFLREWFDVN